MKKEKSSDDILGEIDELLEDLDNTPEAEEADGDTPRSKERSYEEFVADIKPQDSEGSDEIVCGGNIDDLSESKIDQMLEISHTESLSECPVTEDILNDLSNHVKPSESEYKSEKDVTVDIEHEPRKESVDLSDRSEAAEDNVVADVENIEKEDTPVNEDPQPPVEAVCQPLSVEEHQVKEETPELSLPAPLVSLKSENIKDSFSESDSLPPPPLELEDSQTFPDPPLDGDFPEPPVELEDLTQEDCENFPEPPAPCDLPEPPLEPEVELTVRAGSATPPSVTLPSPALSLGRPALSVSKPTAVVKPCYQVDTQDVTAALTDNTGEHLNQDTETEKVLEQIVSDSELLKLDELQDKNLFQVSSQSHICTEEVASETPPKSESRETEHLTSETGQMAEDEDEIIPPAKGYNLDFLDNLDDPNFNPFETKTAVTATFTESAPVPSNSQTEPSVNTESSETLKSTPKPETKPAAKKPLPKKPWLKSKKKPVTAAPAEKTPTPAVEEQKEEDVEEKVPSKGYNLDFLDNLDDPNFNPFETKTAVINKFEDSPATSQKVETSAETEKKEEPAEVVPEKPKEIKKKPVKAQPPKPWLKKKTAKPVVEEIEKKTDEAPEDEVKVPSKGYNLDFLDNIDDPNFNPFETKTSVVETFQDTSSLPEGNIPDLSKVEEKVPNEVGNKEVKDEVKKPKKELPAKPWLKKGKKKVEEPLKVEEDEELKVPAKGYNLDFLNNLEDPNFDPFATKTSVINVEEPSKSSEESAIKDSIPVAEPLVEVENGPESEVEIPKAKGYNLDFLDKLDDPNFNPFETKCEISNKEPESSPPPLEEVSAEEDFPPPPPEELSSDSTQATVVSETFKPPTVIDQATEPVRSRVSVASHSPSPRHSCATLPVTSSLLPLQESTPEFEMTEAEMMLPPPPVQAFEAQEQRPSHPESPSSISSGYSSIPPTTAADYPFVLPEPANLEDLLDSETTFSDNTQTSSGLSDLMRAQLTGERPELSDLAKLGLLHEERLLNKDKEVSRLTAQVKEQEAELDRLRRDLSSHTESNKQMMGIVEEFEKTIQQLIKEKERSQVLTEIDRDRMLTERNQIFEDLQAVERAFTDLHRKYERTKEVIAGFKSNEDVLKSSLEDLTSKYRKEEERFEVLRTHAESKLEE